MTSAFEELGFKDTVARLCEQVQNLYLADEIPWVIGYSGGKDSTATLQLVWRALQELSADQRTKPVHVISTDTLVENPIVSAWVGKSLQVMADAAIDQKLPITPHQLTPTVKDTFWVNLIGKGYPAPRHKFRWCTERLKINPSTAFIRDVVQSHGEAILVLGTRKAESAARAKVMTKFEQGRTRELLSPNGSLPNSFVYSPIEDWSNDDVWLFLMQEKNPWGYNNKDLLTMYQGASADGECPLVVDTSTPSCGDSRFGCWVCTMVEEDKSMQAMIQNDYEKEWMLPLLELRNALDIKDDRDKRDFRRMNGKVQFLPTGRKSETGEPQQYMHIHGPYTQTSRERWLRMLLEAQRLVRERGPVEVQDLELIRLEELEEIRRIWVFEKREIEDSLPTIYKDVLGAEYPGTAIGDSGPFGVDEMNLLREVAEDDDLHFQLIRELLAVEKQQQSLLRRAGLFDRIDEAFERNAYDSVDDAIDRAARVYEAKRDAAEIAPGDAR